MKRILAVLLSVLMIFSLLSVPAFADDAAEDTRTVTIVKQTGIAGVEIDGQLADGNTVQLTPGQHTAVAVPEDGYVFKQWKIGFSTITDTELSFNVPDVARIIVTGAIAVKYYTSVNDEWQLLNTKYPSSKGQITLLKEATAGMVLNEWNTAADGSGDSYTPGQSVTITRSLDLYAQESPKVATYALRVNAGSGVNRSSVTINGKTGLSQNAIPVGSTVTITAAASKPADYEVSSWASIDYTYSSTVYTADDLDDAQQPTPGTFTFTMPDHNVAIQAATTVIGQRNVYIIADDTIASFSGNGSYTIGNTVELSATPAEGYGAIYWKSTTTTVDGVSCTASMQLRGQGDTYSFSMPQYNLAFEIAAKPAQYTVTYIVDDATWKTVSFTTGSSVTAQKTPPKMADMIFREWNTEADGSGDSYAAGAQMALSGDTVLYAIYDEVSQAQNQDYFVSVNKNGLGIKSVSGYSGTFKEGDTVTITATVYDGYENPIWTPTTRTVNGKEYTDQGIEDCVGYTCTFTMPANNVAFELTAQPKRYPFHIEAQDSVVLTCEVPNYVTAGSSVTVSAEPAEGYSDTIVWKSISGEFDGQTYSSMLLFSGNATYTFTMPKAPVALEVSAKPIQPPKTYTVTWKNWDGTVLEVDEGLESGTTPSYDGETPTREGTAQESYVFDGWSPTVAAVSKSVTYKAKYIKVTNEYTVTWKDGDGSIRYQETVVGGSTPVFNSEEYYEPVKEPDASHGYIFTGWSPEPGAITADTVFEPVFAQTAKVVIHANGGIISPEAFAVAQTAAYAEMGEDIVMTAEDMLATCPHAGLYIADDRQSAVFTFDISDDENLTALTASSTLSDIGVWNEDFLFFHSLPNEITVETLFTHLTETDPTVIVAYAKTASGDGATADLDSVTLGEWGADENGVYHIYLVWGSEAGETEEPHVADGPTMYFIAGEGSPRKDEVVAFLSGTEYEAYTSFFFPTAMGVYGNQYELPLTFDSEYTESDWENVLEYMLFMPSMFVSCAGKTPVGWSYTQGGEPIDPDDFGDYTDHLDETGSVRFYAVYETTTYLSFNLNGGVVDDEELMMELALFGASITTDAGDNTCIIIPAAGTLLELATQFLGRPYRYISRDGKYAGGWATNADGSGAISNAALYDLDEDDIDDLNLPTDAVGVVNLYAIWQDTPAYVDVTWKNYDGNVMETDENVPIGMVPVFNNGTPERSMTEQYTYTFDGWTVNQDGSGTVYTAQTLPPLAGTTTYYAHFTESTRLYTITWQNSDGTTLATDTVAYGETPVYPYGTPQHDSEFYTYAAYGSCQHERVFIFSRWSPEVAPITHSTTFTASYRYGNRYTGTLGENVTFAVDLDGSATISGSGPMYDSTDISAFNYAAGQSGGYDAIDVTIQDGVTTIGNHVFDACVSIRSVNIPSSITSIGRAAFGGCTGLSTITIPNSVTSIGELAFYRCGLTNITIPGSITSMGDQAFEYCSALSALTLSDGMTSLGSKTFRYCSALTSVTIPGSVLSTDSMTFEYCTGLETLIIENGVETIGNYSFSGCPALTSISIPSSVTSIGTESFSGCTGLTSVTIPGNVEEINSRAFSGCTSLSSVTLQEGIRKIHNRAFENCADIQAITLPDSIVYMYIPFIGCTSLTSVNVPLGLLLTPEDATYPVDQALRSSGITSVTLPASLTEIPATAFRNCAWLTDITIHNNITSIGRSAFWDCSNLPAITIPNSVTSIGEGAFRNCTSLTSLTIPSSVISIGDSAFNGSGLTSMTIPDTVTTIGDGLFQSCSNLVSATLPSGITEIPSQTFYRCSSLASFTIPSGVRKIETSAFRECTSLISMVIPDGVYYLGSWAFQGCTSLASITIPSSVTSIQTDVFTNCTALTIYGTAGSYAQTYANNKGIPFQAA